MADYWKGVFAEFATGRRKDQALAYEASKLNFTVPLWTKDCAVYRLHSLEDFVSFFLGLQNRAGWYEVIRAEQPCKLYMDVDGPPGLTDVEAFESELRVAVSAELWAQHQYRPVQLNPYVLDATTERKFSRHYVWPVVFADNKAAGRFVDRVKARVAHPYAAHIDTAVYTRDRNFRILFSAKKGKPNALRLLQPASALALPESAQLCRTLVSALRRPEVATSSPLAAHVLVARQVLGRAGGTHHAPRAFGAGAASLAATVYRAAVPESWAPLEADARAWLESHYKTGRVTVSRLPGEARVMQFNLQQSNVVCPSKGRTHKKNGAWFQINLDGRMTRFKCQDRECQFGCWGTAPAPKAWRWPAADTAKLCTEPKRKRVCTKRAASRRTSLV